MADNADVGGHPAMDITLEPKHDLFIFRPKRIDKACCWLAHIEVVGARGKTVNVMKKWIAVLDLKRLANAHADNAGSVDTSFLVNDDRLGGNRRLWKRALQFDEHIGQTAVDISQNGLLHNTFTGIDPGTHGIDPHPDNGIAWKLSAEMNMSLDGSRSTLRQGHGGL